MVLCPPLVLIVEDEWLLRMELSAACEAKGWHVMEAESGEAALALNAKEEAIGLLVTDIRLGGSVTGWEVAETFRRRDPELPVLYVSANLRDPARCVPASKFLSKPIRLEALVEECAALLACR